VARHEISGPTTAPPYSYAEKVDLSGHMLHLTPRVLPGQRVVAARLHAAALPSRISEGADHFGSAVRWLFLDRPHDRFEVTLEAEIDVAFPAPPADRRDPALGAGGRSRRARRAAGMARRRIRLRQPDGPGRPGRRRLCRGQLPARPPGAGGPARAYSADQPGFRLQSR
jgi:hypothetical protein